MKARFLLLLDSMPPGCYVFSRVVTLSLIHAFTLVQPFIPNAGCCTSDGGYLCLSPSERAWFHAWCQREIVGVLFIGIGMLSFLGFWWLW
jgi:hypothetical protein